MVDWIPKDSRSVSLMQSKQMQMLPSDRVFSRLFIVARCRGGEEAEAHIVKITKSSLRRSRESVDDKETKTSFALMNEKRF
jgi:hypothetical protein